MDRRSRQTPGAPPGEQSEWAADHDDPDFVAACLDITRQLVVPPAALTPSPGEDTDERHRTKTTPHRSVDGTTDTAVQPQAEQRDMTAMLQAPGEHEVKSTHNLETLRTEIQAMRSRHEAELKAAADSLTRQEASIARLQETIAERDHEIDELRQAVLKSEQARAAEATALLESISRFSVDSS